MTDDIALSVANVSKRYEIYERPQDRLRQSLSGQLHRLAASMRLRMTPRTFFREFWALRDISFDVRRGEAVGIIGRNGAGKSTLLQIVAGTLQPTAGQVSVAGRVAALLELGSGFSPDFTGAENVRLAAALQGQTRAQIEQCYDDIVSFADIGNFIDQPVKTYSSGMVMRLAFSVHTVVRPDILIADDALSVGDVFFQAKCMARLRELLADGVTLLLVSHDVATVRQICRKAVLLHHGCVLAQGESSDVTDQYMRIELEERNRAGSDVSSRSKGQTTRQSSTVRPVLDTTPAAEPEAPDRADDPRPQIEPAIHAAFIHDSHAPPSRDKPSLKIGDLLFGHEAFMQRAVHNRVGNGTAQFINVQMLARGGVQDLFEFDELVVLRQVIRFHRALENVNISYKIRTPQGSDLVFGDTRLVDAMDRVYDENHMYVLDWHFRLPMMHGNYSVLSAITHPPGSPGEDWRFVDFVPISYGFRMAPRRNGMVDGFVVWRNELEVFDAGDISITELESVGNTA